MRILVLTKRQYMRRDVIDDAYGRFFELPTKLAELGHEVTVVCLSYRKRPVIPWRSQRLDYHSPIWVSHNLIFGLDAYLEELEKIQSRHKPDCILCFSDVFQAIIGTRLGRRWRVPVVVDLYDNFESYGATRFPGVKGMFRRALRRAQAVVSVSQPLQNKIRSHCHPDTLQLVLENAVDKEMFRPSDKQAARQRFDIPDGVAVIGTVGAIQESKDSGALISAYQMVQREIPELKLVLAGFYSKRFRSRIPKDVLLLGDIEYALVPQLIAAMDVGIVSVKNDSFGTYCFPQKAGEFQACQTPIVAARVGALAEKLKDVPETLYEPSDPEGLAQAIRYQLVHHTLSQWQVPSWESQARLLSELLCECIELGMNLRE